MTLSVAFLQQGYEELSIIYSIVEFSTSIELILQTIIRKIKPVCITSYVDIISLDVHYFQRSC